MILLTDEQKKIYLQLIETILFYEGKPVSISEISKMLEIDQDTTLQLLLELKKEFMYLDRGILIQQKEDTFFYIVNPKIKDIFVKIHKIRENKFKLSDSLKEVISIVAFKQPITKTEIDSIRGLDSTYSIKKLLELELIEVKGKKDIPGKPSLYGTTTKFLQLFKLSSLDQLPKPEELLSNIKFFGD